MGHDHTQSRIWLRYEAKYLVSEHMASEVSRRCRDHMPADPHAQVAPGVPYPVLSTYLDSPRCDLLRQTLESQATRYKLRVRTYREIHAPPDGLPLFFEVKQRIDTVIRKSRARLDPAMGEALLWDASAEPAEGAIDEATRTGLDEFLSRRRQIDARPVVGVFYRREAYESPEADRVRITLDRDLAFGIVPNRAGGGPGMWAPAEAGGVILEIKFTSTYPAWVMHMLHRLNLLRCGVCKYVICCMAGGVRGEGEASGRTITWTS